jgi:hypothetical protein
VPGRNFIRVTCNGLLNGSRGRRVVDGYCRWVGWTATWVVCPILLSLALTSQVAAAPAYPLQKSANGRYLVDQNNVPYLITGDSPQALIVNLSTTDAQMFLTDRAANGFNTVWINLLCNTYTGGNANGSTFDGILPFTNALATGSYDLTAPNEAYFARVDQMLTLAAQQGLLVMLDPIETGGWLNTILDNGTNNCRIYGQFLGNRYQNFNNIIWLNGNDYTDWVVTNWDAVVQQVALGIQDIDTRHIQTVELNSPSSGSLDDSSWAPIISLNASYTYYPTYAQVLFDYDRANFLPTIMLEANYELENDWIDNASGRRQEYWSLLSGACGQLYGNHYTWQFLPGWQTELDTAGSTQMEYVTALFAPLAWYNLVPDQNHTLVTAGYGTFASAGSVNDSDYATAATHHRRHCWRWSICRRRAAASRWICRSWAIRSRPSGMTPAAACTRRYRGHPFTNASLQAFTPTGANADGDGDWVLVLQQQDPPTPFQAWQLLYFGCTNCPRAAATADPSGTGQNNLFKYTAGLNPTNPASVFVVTTATVPTQPNRFNLFFNPVVAGRTYTPQYTTDLVSGVWLPLTGYASPVTNGTQVTITDLNATQPKKFYRVDISLLAEIPLFEITSITLSGNDVNLVWNGQPGSNVVQVSTGTSNGGYTNNFVDLAAITMPCFGVTNYLDSGGTTNGQSRFYRIDLRR